MLLQCEGILAVAPKIKKIAPPENKRTTGRDMLMPSQEHQVVHD